MASRIGGVNFSKYHNSLLIFNRHLHKVSKEFAIKLFTVRTIMPPEHYPMELLDKQ